jgi:nitroimidazol reductase NimA-like FMN-containing flavoprotein (pyridoxamine 5'-phosphate oxidase superfamily)
MNADKPIFREMSDEEVDAMLRKHTYGRLAFTFHDRVDIEPIHYVYDEGRLVCRTASGSKVDILRHHPWVAFEIDEVEGLFHWRSVVAKGTAYFRSATPPHSEVAGGASPAEALRRLVPSALTPGDPTPDRSIVFTIHVDSARGRVADPGTAK